MSTSNPKFLSVIVPVYNSQKYLTRCIESIINQSYKNLEILLVDDCSNDLSKDIINSYCTNFNNIKSINLVQRCGAGYARSIGLENAKGKFISFIDSDDWIDSNFYKTMINAIEKTNSDIAISGIMTEEGGYLSSIERYTYKYQNVINGDFALTLLSRSLSQDCYITPIVCNKVYSEDIVKNSNIKFEKGSLHEDDIFTFFALLNSTRIVLTPGCMYHYYQYYNSITHTMSKDYIISLISAFTIIRNQLQKEKKFEKYKCEYFSFLDKCIASTLNCIIHAEKNNIMQKKYVKFLITEMAKELLPLDYFDYIDMNRIKKFYGL